MMDVELEDGEIPSSGNDDISRDSFNQQNSKELPGLLDDTDYVILDRPKSEMLSLPSSISKTPNPSTNISSSSSSSLPAAVQTSAGITSSSVISSTVSHPTPFQYGSSSANPLHGQNALPIPDPNDDYYANYGKKGYYKNLGASLDSSDKDSSASESDDDTAFGKRSRMNMPSSHQQRTASSTSMTSAFDFSNSFGTTGSSSKDPMFSASSSSSFPGAGSSLFNSADPSLLNAFNSAATQFQSQHKQRKPNLVWANVVQEEQIANIFEGVKVKEPGFADVEVTRGPETYHFQRPMRQPRERRESDSSDISSGGLSDNALHYLRDGCSFDDDETGESSEHSLPKTFTSKGASKPANVKKATKRKKSHQKYKKKLIGKLKKMKSNDLGKFMAEKLSETKTKLIINAVEILGKENCIYVFLKTLKIERRGGIMVKTQKRRRTPGGVFFYLIRGDRRFPKSQIDLIFRDERAFQGRVKKQRQVGRRLKNKAKLESELELASKADMDDSEDTATALPTPDIERDGTDTGQYGDDSTQESSLPERDNAEMHCDDDSES